MKFNILCHMLASLMQVCVIQNTKDNLYIKSVAGEKVVWTVLRNEATAYPFEQINFVTELITKKKSEVRAR
jgi:hypothetical protein